MSAAVASLVRVREAYAQKFDSPVRVDPDKGVIYGVKVLGQQSTNKRYYTEACIRDALSRRLYEGAHVWPDHKSNARRSVQDSIGQLLNVREARGPHGLEIRADLWLEDKAAPFSRRLLAAAEDRDRDGYFALSHEAIAERMRQRADGVTEVERLAEVEGVAVVSGHKAATNTSLYEAKGGRTVATLKTVLEARSLDPNVNPAARRFMLEMSDRYAEQLDDMPMDEPAAEPEAAPEDGRSLLHRAIAALAASGDPGDHDLATKVLKLIKPAEGGGEGMEDGEVEEDQDAEGHGYDDEDDKKGNAAMRKRGDYVDLESKKKAGGAVLTEAMARDLCNSVGLKATDTRVELITGLTLPKGLKALAEIKESAGGMAKQPPRSQERSAQGRRVREDQAQAPPASKLPASPAKLREWARNN